MLCYHKETLLLRKYLYLPNTKELRMEQEIVSENLVLMTSKLQFYPDLLESAFFLAQKAPPFFDHIIFYWLGLVPSSAVSPFLGKTPTF